MRRCSLLVLALAACRAPSVDAERGRERFVRVPIDTAPGLSGLAADAHGALWTVSERGALAYRITLDAQRAPAITAFPIDGLPPSTDLEGLAVLDDGHVAFGTEERLSGGATVLLARREGGRLRVTGAIVISMQALGVEQLSNHGAEGVCGAGDTIVAAIEAVGVEGGRRWAPVVRIVGGVPVRTHRLWLTTTTGKLSGLDCRVAPDGTIDVWAIERHFEVTKVLTFTLPPLGAGSDEVTPAVAHDLGPVLRGALNLEGIARLPDGRLVAVTDNQWKTISGPSELLIFAAAN